jgi:predicted enzyme related to lactoylglutathione lyase
MKLSGILIGSEDPKRLVQYYSKLFGDAREEFGYSTWNVGGGWVTIGPHDEVKGKNTQPGRIIWNVETPDVRAEFDRLSKAGATVVQEPYNPGGPDDESGMLIATFADPDGNYFQIMSPMP